MDQTIIDNLRQRLGDEKKNLLTQLEDMGVDPTTGAPDGDQFEQGFADSGQSTDEKTRVLSNAEGVFETMREVDAALARIDDGTYGVCETCGDQIPSDRLEARPVVRLCVSCKRLAG